MLLMGIEAQAGELLRFNNPLKDQVAKGMHELLQDGVLGAGGDAEVELEIEVFEAGIDGFELVAHPIDQRLQAGDLRLGDALGGKGGEFGLEDDAGFADVGNGFFVTDEAFREDAIEEEFVFGGDESAFAVTHLDEAHKSEGFQGFAQGGPAHVEDFAELHFGGETLALPPFSRGHHGRELSGDLLSESLAGDGFEGVHRGRFRLAQKDFGCLMSSPRPGEA